MDWVERFYSTRSRWFGPTGIFAEHRAQAADLERLCGPRIKEHYADLLGLGQRISDFITSIPRGHTAPAATRQMSEPWGLAKFSAAFSRAFAAPTPSRRVDWLAYGTIVKDPDADEPWDFPRLTAYVAARTSWMVLAVLNLTLRA